MRQNAQVGNSNIKELVIDTLYVVGTFAVFTGIAILMAWRG